MALRLPLRGLWTGQGCPWPTALFSFQMKWVEKSTDLDGEGCGGGPVVRQAGGCSWAQLRQPSGCRVWTHWACLYRGERVLAFGRHRCCHHCPLSSVRIRLTLADFCSRKYWPGTPTHRLALYSKLCNKTCRKRYFELILVLSESLGDCLFGSSGKSVQTRAGMATVNMGWWESCWGCRVWLPSLPSADSHAHAVHAECRQSPPRRWSAPRHHRTLVAGLNERVHA